MRRISSFLMGAVVGGVLVFISLKFHLVRAEDGFYLVPKVRSTFRHAYVDIRGFGAAQWSEHRWLAAALVRSNKEHLLQGAVTAGFAEAVRGAIDSLAD